MAKKKTHITLLDYAELAQHLRAARGELYLAAEAAHKLPQAGNGGRCARHIRLCSDYVGRARMAGEDAMFDQYPGLGNEWLHLFYGEPDEVASLAAKAEAMLSEDAQPH